MGIKKEPKQYIPALTEPALTTRTKLKTTSLTIGTVI